LQPPPKKAAVVDGKSGESSSGNGKRRSSCKENESSHPPSVNVTPPTSGTADLVNLNNSNGSKTLSNEENSGKTDSQQSGEEPKGSGRGKEYFCK